MTEVSQELQEKLLIIDELSKAYQRIAATSISKSSEKVDKSKNKLLDKIIDVVDGIKPV